MSEWEFMHTTLNAYHLKLEAYNERFNFEYKTSWEQTRFITFNIMDIQGKKTKDGFKPKDLILFDWEKQKSLPKKEIENSRERFEYLKKKWHKAE